MIRSDFFHNPDGPESEDERFDITMERIGGYTEKYVRKMVITTFSEP